MYKVIYTKAAQKDALKLAKSNLKERTKKILELLAENPTKKPPPFEKLVGDLAGCYSRRINIQHRIVYTISEDTKTVKVLRMWSHYE